LRPILFSSVATTLSQYHVQLAFLMFDILLCNQTLWYAI
jgi:hypothetical protein